MRLFHLFLLRVYVLRIPILTTVLWVCIVMRVLRLFLLRVYFLRIPILTLGLLVGIVPVAFQTGAESLLANLFDLKLYGLFWVTMFTFLVTWSCMLHTQLIVMYSHLRFGIEEWHINSALKWSYLLLFGLFALPITIAAAVASEGPIIRKLVEVACGLLGALCAISIVRFVQSWLDSPKVARTIPSPLIQGPLGAPFKAMHEANPLAPWLARIKEWLSIIPRGIGSGYLRYDERGKVVEILQGHGLAVALVLLAFVLYVVVGVMKYIYLGFSFPVPALAYGLLLLLLLSWLLSACTFFFDRYRVPLTLVIVVWAVINGVFPSSDSFYHVQQRAASAPLSPAQVAHVGEPDSIIVVAANGGGIQSAAWTARVLTGLEEATRAEGSKLRPFSRSVRLISAVSGGSVGAMYVVNAYSPAGLPSDPKALAEIVADAKTSSIDELGWGFAYPDFWRVFLPIGPGLLDRGGAMENAWSGVVEPQGTLSAPLSSWQAGVEAGWRPATIFNATIADTGERLLLATTDFADTKDKPLTFYQRYPGYDLSVVTAARLSATFPYVAPAARAAISDTDSPGFHVVDGGYYDNYGMVSLVQWLDDALRDPNNNHIKHVLVIQIHGAPVDEETAATNTAQMLASNDGCPPPIEPKDTYKRENSRGWFYQSFAPLSTLVRVRNTGQLAHANVELDLLKRLWAESTNVVEIETVLFQFNGPNPPLSWHLTKQQQDDIETYWQAELRGCNGREGVQIVRSFLAQGQDAAQAAGGGQ